MTLIPLCTNGSGNHPPEAYADACARTIFNIDPSITIERSVAAHSLLTNIGATLIPYFVEVTARETENLMTYSDHCDSQYVVRELAEKAVNELQRVAAGTPWGEKLKDVEWEVCALNTIANHLATAVHVERLLFADSNPNNQSAVAYKRRHHGVH